MDKASLERYLRRTDIRAIIFIYLVSQFFYRIVLQTEFASGTVRLFSQYLDPELLRNDLLVSLFYLHMQPPLMNFLIGIMLKIAPENYGLLFEGLYFVCGLVALGFLNETFVLLHIRQRIRLFVAGWLCLFPTFYLYGHWGYSTHLEFLLCSIVVFILARWQHNPSLRFRDGVILFIPFCLLGLLRAQWHLVFFLGILALLLWPHRRTAPKAPYALGMTAALSPLLLLYLKNFLLFGFFGASSWLGMNMSPVAWHSLPSTAIKRLQADGTVSPFFPINFNITKARGARQLWKEVGIATPAYDHPAFAPTKSTGRENQNALSFIEGGKQDLADSLAIIRHHPLGYARTVVKKTAFIATYPSVAFDCCGFSLRRLKALDLEYQQLPMDIKLLMNFGSFLLYVAAPLLIFLLVLNHATYLEASRPLVMTGFFLTTFMLVLSCAANQWEQERMRWGLEPFYLVFFALLVEWAARRQEKKGN